MPMTVGQSEAAAFATARVEAVSTDFRTRVTGIETMFRLAELGATQARLWATTWLHGINTGPNPHRMEARRATAAKTGSLSR